MLKATGDIERQQWEGLQKGDSEALAWLYDRYFNLLYNYGRKISADEEILEDSIQDLFVDLWRFRANLSPTTSIRFYLYRSLRRRLVRNQKLERLPEEGRMVPAFEENVPSEEQDIIAREVADRRLHHLKKLLGDLSPRQYEAMVLRFYDELSFEEIAAILDVNEQSARNLVQRGVAQLKQFSKLLLTWLIVLCHP